MSINKRLIMFAASLLLIGAGCPLFPAQPTRPTPPMRGCTKELKICPDGTGVGRTGPNCEFEACPAPQEPTPCKENGDCKNGFCGATEDGGKVCKAWRNEGEACGGFTMPAFQYSCRPGLTCVCSEPTCDAPGTCRPPEGKPVPTPKPEPVACTMEAKQCPDGSYVGRVPPTCEFSPCPPSR